MNHTVAFLSALLLCGGSLVAAADTPAYQPEDGAKAETSKKLVWSFKPDPSLPNVLILGDSISIGYTLRVRELLRGRANVFRPVSPDGAKPVNCEGTTLGVQQIDRWLAGRLWAVIHFNWGLHDLKHVIKAGTSQNSDRPDDLVQASVEAYRRNLTAIVRQLQATGARLIFATTTPVAPGTINPLREVEAPARYNAAALRIMKTKGISVDDLYATCESSLTKWQLPRNVHFTPEGSAALARQAAAAIEAALPPTAGRSTFR
jgi:acyl-CoA thioesterase-1